MQTKKLHFQAVSVCFKFAVLGFSYTQSSTTCGHLAVNKRNNKLILPFAAAGAHISWQLNGNPSINGTAIGKW